MVTRNASNPVTVYWGTVCRLGVLAREAGRAIMLHYHEPVTVEHKEDRSPVTAADRDAHAVIVKGLEGWYPGVPVISEEGALPPHSERSHWDRFWLVDPLDGTK
ncbi:MAG: 3'(2'),5'-bisphosphate nucleotidase CysQ family protein, partial [Gemmatimonadales bacterium]